MQHACQMDASLERWHHVVGKTRSRQPHARRRSTFDKALRSRKAVQTLETDEEHVRMFVCCLVAHEARAETSRCRACWCGSGWRSRDV